MADEFLESIGLNGMAEGGETPPENHAPDSEPAPELTPAPAPEPETKPAPPKDGDKQPDPEETRTPGKNEAERLRELEAEKTRLEQENARLKKRQHDTQSAYTRAHQRLKQLEKGGKPGDPATPEEEPGDWFGEDSPEAGSEAEEKPPEEPDTPEGPEAAQPEADPELKRKVDRLSAQQEELRKAEALRIWNAAETSFRSEHADYDAVVGNELDEAINAGDELSGYLMSKFKKLGATPEAAYKVGQELRRMKGEATPAPAPETKTKTPASRQDDPGWNSMPPDEGGGESATGSLIDEVLSGK